MIVSRLAVGDSRTHTRNQVLEGFLDTLLGFCGTFCEVSWNVLGQTRHTDEQSAHAFGESLAFLCGDLSGEFLGQSALAWFHSLNQSTDLVNLVADHNFDNLITGIGF